MNQFNRDPKVICLITARSGSKGLPHKNMLFLDNKPMLFHTIYAALDSGCFAPEDIYVSTDSCSYQEICRETGVNVVLRPAELALDTTTSFEVIHDFLRDFPDEQTFVLLQPTSPLRTGKQIKDALTLFESDSSVENVVSMVKSDKPLCLFTRLSDAGLIQDNFGGDRNYRRQDKVNYYHPNGAIYISTKAAYVKNESFLTPKTKAYLMNKQDSLDIDDVIDFQYAINNLAFTPARFEEKNQHFYQESYEKLSRQKNALADAKGVVLGDSRLVDFVLPGFVNWSLSGVTLATAVKHLNLILQRKPQYILLALGINDLRVGYRYELIIANLKKFLATCSQAGTQVILANILPTLYRYEVDNAAVSQFNQELADLAKKDKFPLIDLTADLCEKGELLYRYTSDGLHLNQTGQAICNRNITARIEKMQLECGIII